MWPSSVKITISTIRLNLFGGLKWDWRLGEKLFYRSALSGEKLRLWHQTSPCGCARHCPWDMDICFSMLHSSVTWDTQFYFSALTKWLDHHQAEAHDSRLHYSLKEKLFCTQMCETQGICKLLAKFSAGQCWNLYNQMDLHQCCPTTVSSEHFSTDKGSQRTSHAKFFNSSTSLPTCTEQILASSTTLKALVLAPCPHVLCAGTAMP